MDTTSEQFSALLAEQQSIQAKCFHPSGTFIPFKKDDVEQSIPSRFEEQVRQYPNLLAVKTRNQELTYDELNKASNQVARAILEQRGGGAEPIALLLEKSISQIVAILAVLKTGKIFVTLDFSHPRARLEYMLEDSGAGLIVTNNKNSVLAHDISQNGCQLINIDDLDYALCAENLDLSIPSDALACIFYTSGTTGQPKGVVDNHRNLLHLTMSRTNDYHVCAQDRLVFLSTAGRLAFVALLNGAAIYPIETKLEDPSIVASWLIQEEITICHSVVSTFRQFASTLTGAEEFPKLRLICLLGESVYKQDVELYKTHFSQDCLFVNSFGGSETSGCFSRYFVDKDTQITGTTVPVGFAVEDKQILLLDDAGQELGLNQIAEIAVKSRYLSSGYWRRPELTSIAFLPDPEDEEQRIYRTGDLARMLPGGCLMYLGRKDFQAKIRGNRVEVAEVEMALLALDTVKEAAVVAQETAAGEQRLVAFIVPTGKPPPTVSALHRMLTEKLPAYMIPSAFVMMNALPLTGIDKVDRRALLAPGNARPNLDNPFVPPRTPIEVTLVRIWAEALELDQLGIHDSFLELGGNSLLAASVFARVEEAFGKKLPLSMLIQASTVAQFASVLGQDQNSITWSSLVPIQSQGTKPPFFCVHGAGGHVLGFTRLAQYLGSDQPFYGLEAPGRDGEQEPLNSIEDLATHYMKEIQTVQPEGPYYLGGLCMGGTVAFEMAQQLRDQGQDVALVALLDTPVPVGRDARARARRRWQMMSRRVRGLARHWHYLTKESRGQRGKYILEKARLTKRLLTRDAALRRANHRASLSYVAEMYRGRVVQFLARDEPVMELPDRRLRWDELVDGGVEVYEIPGNENGMLGEPYVTILAEQLSACFDKSNTA